MREREREREREKEKDGDVMPEKTEGKTETGEARRRDGGRSVETEEEDGTLPEQTTAHEEEDGTEKTGEEGRRMENKILKEQRRVENRPNCSVTRSKFLWAFKYSYCWNSSAFLGN